MASLWRRCLDRQPLLKYRVPVEANLFQLLVDTPAKAKTNRC